MPRRDSRFPLPIHVAAAYAACAILLVFGWDRLIADAPPRADAAGLPRRSAYVGASVLVVWGLAHYLARLSEALRRDRELQIREDAAGSLGVAASSGREGATRSGRRAGRTILVVDDEPQVRRVITAALRREGHAVFDTGDPEAAMQTLREEPAIDLVVCDFMLESITGVELVRRMSAQRPSLKILFITGLTQAELIEEDPTLAGYPFIEKPFSMEDLTRSVDDLWVLAG